MSRAERTRQRADRIREQISIIDVLQYLRYNVRDGDREQQFSCDLHGSGQDLKPSARVYPDSNGWYCYGCGSQRDSIQTVREKLGISFLDACKFLERKFEIGPPEWGDDDEDYEDQTFDVTFSTEKSFEEETTRVRKFLDTMTKERVLTLKKVLSLWEVYDMILWKHQHRQYQPGGERAALSKLLERAKESMYHASQVPDAEHQGLGGHQDPDASAHQG